MGQKDPKENMAILVIRVVLELVGIKETEETLWLCRGPLALPDPQDVPECSTALKEQFFPSLPDHTAKRP